MNKKGQVNMLILMTVVGILTVVILGVIFTFLQDNSLNIQGANETVNIAAQAGQTTFFPITSTTHFSNSSDDLTANLGTDVNISSSGAIATGVGIAGDYFAVYRYEPTAYIDSGITRTIVAIIPLMLALLVFVFFAGFLTLRK